MNLPSPILNLTLRTIFLILKTKEDITLNYLHQKIRLCYRTKLYKNDYPNQHSILIFCSKYTSALNVNFIKVSQNFHKKSYFLKKRYYHLEVNLYCHKTYLYINLLLENFVDLAYSLFDPRSDSRRL
jgi:hypothetical protein